MLQQPKSSSVFVGRRAELEALETRLRAAGEGHGSTMLLNGEAGVGKSRLVAEVSLRAEQILRGLCFETDSTLPFAPVVDLLRGLLSSLPADEAAAMVAPYHREIAHLLPELAPAGEFPATLAVDSEWDKRRLFHALDELIASVARAAPLLVVVEDLHWGDDTSLEYCLHLARRVERLPILLLFTYRMDEVQPALASMLAALDRERLAAEISLSPLTIDEVDTLLRAIFEQPHPIRMDFLRAIYALTEGNAFFVEEIVGALVSSGDIYRTAGRWDRKALSDLRIPRSVHHAVIRRTDGLSPEAGRLLRVAAVAGQRFSFTVLLEVMSLQEQDLIDAVRELIGANVIVEESADRFRFRHALIRQAVYDDLLARERNWMHRTLGETIEALHAGQGDMPLADLSYHFHAAEAWEKAGQYAPLAGRRAQDLYAPRAAIEHFTRALDAAHHLLISPDPDLQRQRGLAHATLGEFDLALSDLEMTLDFARSSGDRTAEWQALFDLGCLWLGYDYGKAGGYFESALLVARETGDRGQIASTLLQLGNWQVNTERPSDAERSLTDALQTFEEIGDRHAIAGTLDLLGIAADMAGDLCRMREFLERAIEQYQALGDRRGLSSALATLTNVAGLPVFNAAAIPASMAEINVIELIDEALAIAREIDWRSGEAFATLGIGIHYTHIGRFREAANALAEGLRIAMEIKHNEWLTIGHYGQGELYLGVLAVAEARACLERALDVAQASGSLHFYHLVTGSLASACIAAGDIEAAADVLGAAESALPMETVGQRRVWLARAELAAVRGMPDDAVTIIDRILAGAPNVNEQGDIPHAARLRGEALLALGRTEEAEAALQGAAAEAARHSMRSLLWQVQRSLGMVYQSCGREHDALLAFERARAVTDELASTIDDAAVRSNFLERASAMLPAPSTGDAAVRVQLTPREQDVVILVADGLSNRAIAEALFVSERTVETHVSNALNKLGFNSRTQIATWAVENGLR